MKIPILKVRDDNGNENPVLAIKGKDGITPHIGKNGNWFIGDKDTGVPAGGSGSGLGMTLLWENAAINTYVDFTPQVLTVKGGYSKYLVQVVSGSCISYLFMQRSDALVGYSDDYVNDEYVWIENYGAFIAAVHELASANVYIREFRLYSDDDTKIYIGNGYTKSANSSESSNTACIPWRIYGIK